MTTDRELLEAAAKAAGLRIVEQRSGGLPWTVEPPSGPRHTWNPLTDDGDALRLAVKLELQLDLRHSTHEVSVYGASERIDEGAQDPYTATRRAITRAAAAMAKEG